MLTCNFVLRIKEFDLKQAQGNVIAQAKEQATSIEDALKMHEEDKKQIRAQAKFGRDAMNARHRIEVNEINQILTLVNNCVTNQAQLTKQLRADKQLGDQAIAKQVSITAQFQVDKEVANVKAEEGLK